MAIPCLALAFDLNVNLLPMDVLLALGVCSVMSTLCDPMYCSLLGYSVHGTSQARILEWVAISYSKGSSYPGVEPVFSCIGRQILCQSATWEALT